MSEIETPARGRIPVDSDALIFLIPLAVLGLIGWVCAWAWLWIPVILLMAGVIAFFRDPPRSGPLIPGALWSPADGKVVAVEPNQDPIRGPVPGTKIVIFLSVLNCHINRAPCAGRVTAIRYQPGLFLDARDPNSSEKNECNWVFLDAGSHKVTVRQIAGLIARRIVCRVREGQSLRRGQRIGLIRFGSRTEMYLPPQAQIKVAPGQKVRGGETVMAVIPE